MSDGFDPLDFLDWWSPLPGWIRYPVATAIIAGSTWGFMSTARFGGKVWGLGWALGFTLLVIGPSKTG
jgi:hypothetical protein